MNKINEQKEYFTKMKIIFKKNYTKTLELKDSVNEIQNALEKHWKWSR